MTARRMIIGSGLFCSVLVLCVAYWYIAYKNSLKPKCIGQMKVDEIKSIAPDFDAWQATARPWEFVPDSIVQKVAKYLKVRETENLVATYRRKIVCIEPYSFHAVKGEIIFQENKHTSKKHTYVSSRVSAMAKHAKHIPEKSFNRYYKPNLAQAMDAATRFAATPEAVIDNVGTTVPLMIGDIFAGQPIRLAAT